MSILLSYVYSLNCSSELLIEWCLINTVFDYPPKRDWNFNKKRNTS